MAKHICTLGFDKVNARDISFTFERGRRSVAAVKTDKGTVPFRMIFLPVSGVHLFKASPEDCKSFLIINNIIENTDDKDDECYDGCNYTAEWDINGRAFITRSAFHRFFSWYYQLLTGLMLLIVGAGAAHHGTGFYLDNFPEWMHALPNESYDIFRYYLIIVTCVIVPVGGVFLRRWLGTPLRMALLGIAPAAATALFFAASLRTSVLVISVIAALITAAGLVINLKKLKGKPKERKKSLLRSIFKVEKRVVKTFACILLAVVISLNVISPFKRNANPSSLNTDKLTAAYSKACACLDDKHWEAMDVEQKAAVLQDIIDYEAAVNLGCCSAKIIPEFLNGILSFTRTNGSTSYDNSIIYIDVSHLDEDPTYDVVITALHELRHVWQGYVSSERHSEERNAKLFKNNIRNYTSGYAYNYTEYYLQPIEVDARRWSNEQINNYTDYLTLDYGSKKNENPLENCYSDDTYAISSKNGSWKYYTFSSLDGSFDPYVMLAEYIGTDPGVNIPDEIGGNPVKALSENTFDESIKITSLNIPASVEDMGVLTLCCCESLSEITVSEENAVYSAVNNMLIGPLEDTEHSIIFVPDTVAGEVTLPEGIESIAWNAFSNCKKLTAINVPASSESYYSIDGVVYSKSSDILVLCPEGKTGTFTVADGAAGIGREAFSGCSFDNIIIPPSVEIIKDGAFASASVNELIIPPTVELCSSTAFSSIEHIEKLTLSPETEFCDSNCTRKTFDFYFNGSSGIKTICFNGTEEQWKALKMILGSSLKFSSHDSGDITVRFADKSETTIENNW